MFCKYCGKEVNEKFRFCPSCGEELNYNPTEEILIPKEDVVEKHSINEDNTTIVDDKKCLFPFISSVIVAFCNYFLFVCCSAVIALATLGNDGIPIMLVYLLLIMGGFVFSILGLASNTVKPSRYPYKVFFVIAKVLSIMNIITSSILLIFDLCIILGALEV